MQDITGTIIKIKDFLFNIETEVKIKYNNESFPVLKFEKDRVLSIPDYQREIRWEKENLFALMNDISNGAKFLGNIILSSVNNKTFLIIDGQQRLISLNMLVNYIKHRYGDEIDDIGDLVEIKLNCFDKFRQYQECHYSLSEVDSSVKAEILSSDKFKQTKSLGPLYQFISTSKLLDTPDKARKFLEKLKHCKVNVIVADEEDVKTSTEYYIDVNLKGIKLDTEDIFKGYLLSHDSSIQIRQDWVELKKAWINFNENLSTFKADNAYPLTKILEHYIYCYIFSKSEYENIRMDEEFLLSDQCVVNGTQYYRGDHIIKVVNNNTLMRQIIEDAKEYIECLNSIIEDDGGVPAVMKQHLKNVTSKTRKIICNIIKKSIIDKVLIVPKMLVLKYYIEIVRTTASEQTCKEIFAIYFYMVLFMLFGDKKSDSDTIKKITRSKRYYADLISEIKSFVSNNRMATTRFTALARWNSNFNNEELQYKCKSLATIYNYFKIVNDRVVISSVDDVYSFLNDDCKYSIEHFLVNKSGKVKYLEEIEEYPIPDGSKQYNSYIFNFIFVPDDINKNILKDYSLQRKKELLETGDHIKDISCDYSKMVIDVLKDLFIDSPVVENLDEAEVEELDKYWLVSFKREYTKYAERVIDKIIERFSESVK